MTGGSRDPHVPAESSTAPSLLQCDEALQRALQDAMRPVRVDPES